MGYHVLVAKKGIIGIPKEMFSEFQEPKAKLIEDFTEDGDIIRGEELELPIIVGKTKDGNVVVCEVESDYFDDPSSDNIKERYYAIGAVVTTKGLNVKGKKTIHTVGMWSDVDYVITVWDVFKKYEEAIRRQAWSVEVVDSEEKS